MLPELADSARNGSARVRDDEITIRRSVDEEILNSLKFHTKTERFEGISEAHAKTFQWIFRDAEISPHAGQVKARNNFPEWLRTGTGIYWINGKAASGKSTLMKYLDMHPETLSNLN